MPTRKRRANKHFKNDRAKTKKISIYFLLFSLTIFIIALIVTHFRIKYWTKSDKVNVVTLDEQKNIHLVILDPVSDEITTIRIPANTEVDVSGNLGVWRLGNVWELGKNEKVDGQLLARTVTQHFKVPVYVWSDESFLELINSDLFHRIKALFTFRKTNLNISDVLHIFFFGLKVKDINKTEIDLATTSYFEETKLEDGETGYISKDKLPSYLKSLFFSYYLKDKVTRVLIRDETGKYGITDNVAEVVETLGADVAAVIREGESDIFCEVKSIDKEVSNILVKTLSCDRSDEGIEGGYDAEVILGGKYIYSF